MSNVASSPLTPPSSPKQRPPPHVVEHQKLEEGMEVMLVTADDETREDNDEEGSVVQETTTTTTAATTTPTTQPTPQQQSPPPSPPPDNNDEIAKTLLQLLLEMRTLAKAQRETNLALVELTRALRDSSSSSTTTGAAVSSSSTTTAAATTTSSPTTTTTTAAALPQSVAATTSPATTVAPLPQSVPEAEAALTTLTEEGEEEEEEDEEDVEKRIAFAVETITAGAAGSSSSSSHLPAIMSSSTSSAPPPPTSQQQQKPSSFDDDDEDEEDYDDDEDESEKITRMTVRIDGVEVYAVVSALTVGTLMSSFDSFDPTSSDWSELYNTGYYGEITRDLIFLLAGVIGIVFGLHCTLIYSLITIYARTGLGIKRDDELGTFFHRTADLRHRGFKSFILSLYALMVKQAVSFAQKCPESIRLIAFLSSCFMMYMVDRDTRCIVHEAKVFFRPSSSNAKNVNNNGGGSDGLGSDSLRGKLKRQKTFKLSQILRTGNRKED